MHFIISLIIFSLLAPFAPVVAQSSARIEINPYIINATAKAKEILEYNVKVKNITASVVEFYPSVHDLTSSGGLAGEGEPSELDKATSLARWIRIKRSQVKLRPGEEVSLPLTIEVNMNALPGKYNAVIAFSAGGNRTIAAENLMSSNQPKLVINLEIEDQIVERAQIQHYSTGKTMFVKPPIPFDINIINFGNRDIVPQGNLLIYNRRGEEVSRLPVNEEGDMIAPEKDRDFHVEWPEVVGAGKFKVKLEMEYGQKDIRDLQDTVYFWYLPLKWLVTFTASVFLLIILLTYILFKKTYHNPVHARAQHAHPGGVLDLKQKK